MGEFSLQIQSWVRGSTNWAQQKRENGCERGRFIQTFRGKYGRTGLPLIDGQQEVVMGPGGLRIRSCLPSYFDFLASCLGVRPFPIANRPLVFIRPGH